MCRECAKIFSIRRANNMVIAYRDEQIAGVTPDGESIMHAETTMKDLYLKFNICRTPLDTEMLDKNIENFKNQTGTNPYLFMSFDTAKNLNGDDWHLREHCLNYTIDMVGYYKDCKAFLDATKDYGDIELR